MSQIDYGYVIKKRDDFFIVKVDLNDFHSGYGVVSREDDPYNKYDLADVQAYAAEHPEKVLTEHPMTEEVEKQRQLKEEQRKLEDINRQVFDAMVDAVFMPGVSTASLVSENSEEAADPVESLLAARSETMAAIAELKEQIDALRIARQSA